MEHRCLTLPWPAKGLRRLLCLFVLMALFGAGAPVALTREATTAPLPGPEPDGTLALNWTIESVDMPKSFRLMEDRSLALDSNGYPHIAYGDDALFYARYDGQDWHLEVVETNYDVGESAAIALDAADHPHISYYDRGGGNLKYAHYDGISWKTIVVEGIGSC